ncbi:MAG: hypothetical protein HXY37_04230 [Chloroflexi bacterium]|nr:hypothetical protein [Chloroflexota bacterium]
MLASWQAERGLTIRTKLITLALVWIMLGGAALFLVNSIVMKLVLLGLAGTKTVVLARIRRSSRCASTTSATIHCHACHARVLQCLRVGCRLSTQRGYICMLVACIPQVAMLYYPPVVPTQFHIVAVTR